MVEYSKQNTKKRIVPLLCIVWLLPLFICEGQINTDADKIELVAAFSRDTVIMGDSLDLFLTYKNLTDVSMPLFPYAIIFMTQNKIHDAFYSNEFIDRDFYLLNFTCVLDSIAVLKPNELFKMKYLIKANDRFFDMGENSIHILYVYFILKKKAFWKKNIIKTSLSLKSKNFNLYVIPKQ